MPALPGMGGMTMGTVADMGADQENLAHDAAAVDTHAIDAAGVAPADSAFDADMSSALDAAFDIEDDMDWDVVRAPRIPRVSVLITTRNGAAMVGYTLRSVLAQSYVDFEVVVVDDQSTDGTQDVVRAFDDTRIRLLSTPARLGIAGARNFGFAQCQGAYIAPVEQTDIWLPFRLARQVAYLDLHADTALVATATQRLVGGARVASPEPERSNPGFLRWALLIGNPVVWSSVLLRKSAVQSVGIFNRADRDGAEDYDLYHRLAQVGDVARIDEVLTLFRADPDSQPVFNGAMLPNATRVLQDAYEPILGAGAARAAQVMARHVGGGEPVPDVVTLRVIEAVLRAATQYVRSNHMLDEVARALIAAERPALMQRLVRTAIRAGTISPGVLRREGLLHHAALPAGELLRASMLGLVRGTAKSTREPAPATLRMAPAGR
jgi:hypothetical protein